MSEPLPVDAVQVWIDKSGVKCGVCGESSFTVLETEYDSFSEGAFEKVSPHRARIECDVCGEVTTHSLMKSVVKDIRDN